MKPDERNIYMARDGIMKLLSDDEVAKVSTAETAPKLAEGDEYIDLEALDRGVRVADGVNSPMGRVLPRKAVRESTWLEIVTSLASHRIVASHTV